MTRQFLWWTFKFTLNEEEKKTDRKKKKKNAGKHTEWKSLCHRFLLFFSPKRNTCNSIKISVFFVFHMNAALYLFHIDSFSLTHPLPLYISPPRKTLPDPNEVTCKKNNKKNTKGKKNTKKPKKEKKIQKNSKFKRSVGSGGGGEPGYDQVSSEKTSEKTMTGRTMTLFWWGFFSELFCLFVFFWEGGGGGTPRRHARQTMS